MIREVILVAGTIVPALTVVAILEVCVGKAESAQFTIPALASFAILGAGAREASSASLALLFWLVCCLLLTFSSVLLQESMVMMR